MPVLGIGTWEMGGRETANLTDRGKYIESLRFAIQEGFSHIDTAEMYGAGEAERITGEAISPFNREKLFITTKVWPTNLSDEKLQQSAFNSLKRLRCDYVDSLLIHAPGMIVPIEESLETMIRLKEKHFTRSIGLSNFSLEQMIRIEALFPGEIDVCQNEYSLQSINKGLLTENSHSGVIPFCRANRIAFVAWRPLGKGSLIKSPTETMVSLSRKYECTPAQLAIAWTIHKAGTAAIVKATSEDHIRENATASRLKLSPADYNSLIQTYDS